MELLVKGCCGYYQQGGLRRIRAQQRYCIQDNPRVKMAGALLRGHVTLLFLYLLFLKHPLIATDRRSGVGPGRV